MPRAALYDSVTGCEYSLNPDQRITTASVLKAEILAGLMLRAQREARSLTSWEHARVVPMIRYSADPEAQALWRSLGGVEGMRSVDRALGLTRTTPTQPWGLTLSSARDRNTVLRRLIWGHGGLLSASYRMRARAYRLDVTHRRLEGVRLGESRVDLGATPWRVADRLSTSPGGHGYEKPPSVPSAVELTGPRAGVEAPLTMLRAH